MAKADDPPEGFAGRWSRLKTEARATAAAPPVVETDAPLPAVADPPEAAAEPEKPVELPPLDTLTKDSDYSLFMRADVGSDVRTQALRKLWTLDPHFATIDISECHSIDFNAVQTFPEGLKNTIYRVGSGMVEAVEEIERAEAEEAKRAAAATAAVPAADSNRNVETPATDEPPKSA